MSAEVYNTLQNDAGVTAIVGTDVYWVGDVPLSVTAPYLVIQTIYSDADNDLTGDRQANTRERVQIDCYADTVAECHQLRDAVRAAMAGISAATINAGTLLDEGTGIKRFLTEFSVYS